MSVVISSSYVVATTADINANNPLIGWENLVTAANVSATTEAVDFPASNVANPSTNLRWEGASTIADEYLTFAVASTDPIDYVAIARHNLGSAQIAVSVEFFDIDQSPPAWVELVADTMLPNDGPALFRFTPRAVESIRLRMQPGTAVPTIAVVYVGALLVLQRRLYVGHTPIPYGRVTKVTNARSENGQFLGRIVTGQKTGTAVALQNLTPAWYRLCRAVH